MEELKDLVENLSLPVNRLEKQVALELDITQAQVNKTLELLKENTIPFIARYRKEWTNYLDEEQIRNIDDRFTSLFNLEERKIEILKNIEKKGKLTADLYHNILECKNMSILEDIYAPYKQKKKTRGMKALEANLKELSEKMLILDNNEIEILANDFLNPEKDIHTADDALKGAMDILAEKNSQDLEKRELIYNFIFENTFIQVDGNQNKEESTYKMYYDYHILVKNLKAHHILAINRGEKEKELSVSFDFDKDLCENLLSVTYPPKNDYEKMANTDSIKRLLLPSILREIRKNETDKADEEGISLFSINLKNLLFQAPIPKSRILAIDPGIRTGSKMVALDENGKLLDYFTLFVNRKKEESSKKTLEFIENYHPNLIAIGNGTGSHEVQVFISNLIQENKKNLEFTSVDEDGASVYSASPLAKEEFPDLDLTIRGAISIGRRIQDPLAELVKIDPKSIGVGLYQHDINQTKLSQKLQEVVESVVNNVGVNINTASFSLLQYISGITKSIAKNIVKYRESKGSFSSREELLKVSGMGNKIFEQAIGFIKVPESKETLDNTWVHPENYKIAKEVQNLLKNAISIDKSKMDELTKKFEVSNKFIKEISEEIQKPNRTPRDNYPKPITQKGVLSFNDLKVGMKVKGKIKNVVNFGAFVDIGIKESALLHLSEISDHFVNDALDELKLGEIIEAQIIDLDSKRKRISLSCKALKDPVAPRKKKQAPKQTHKKTQINTDKGTYNAFANAFKK